MVLFHLLKNITLRHLRLHKGRTLLSMIGIALGVGVFVSVQMAIHTAIESFNASVDHVSGKANLQITSFGRGFSEEVYLKVKKVPGVKAATPVIQYTSKMDEPIGEPLYLLGIDVFSDQPFREYQFYESEDEGLLFFKRSSFHCHHRKIGQSTRIKERGENHPHRWFKKSHSHHYKSLKDGGAGKIIGRKFWPH